MSYSGGWRPSIESALALDVGALLRGVKPGQRVQSTLSWSRDGADFANIGAMVELRDTFGAAVLDYCATGRDGGSQGVQCVIALESVPLPWGTGRRWFMVCPYTGRRARILRKFPGIDRFCHASAIRPRPTYRSQRDSGSERVMRQRWALRRKLGDKVTDLTCEPYKPKWTRWRTFNRIAARDAALAELEDGYLCRMMARWPGIADELALLGRG